MRTIFIFLSVLLLSLACKPEKNTFVIEGKLTGLDDDVIYLVYPSVNDQQVDTIEVKNGKFRAKGNILAPDVYFLTSESMEFPIELFLEEGKFKVQGDLADKDKISIKGGKLQETYTRYKEAVYPIYDEYIKVAQVAEKETNPTKREEYEVQIKDFAKKYANASLSFLEKEPVSMVTAFVISNELLYDPQINRIDALTAKFDEQVKASKYAQIIKTNLESARKTAPGVVAPLFTMNDMEGNQISLESYKGKYVLVDFWASWCKPCRVENPRIVALYNQYKSPQFDILGVSVDRSPEQWKAAVREDQLSWTQVLDTENISNSAYGVVGIPANVLLDPNGKVIAKNIFGRDLEAELKKIGI